MEEWYQKIVSLFVEYKLTEKAVNEAVKNENMMKFRLGTAEFLKNMHEKRVPVIIISAGIGNFIELFLRQKGCLYDNIHIISNFIKFENGLAIGMNSEIIHSQNKDVVLLNDAILKMITGRKDILLFGDNLEDTKMVPEEKRRDTIRIGFLDYQIR